MPRWPCTSVLDFEGVSNSQACTEVQSGDSLKVNQVPRLTGSPVLDFESARCLHEDQKGLSLFYEQNL